MELDNRETLTVIAELRLLQSLYDEREQFCEVPPSILEIFRNADCQPLAKEEIDDLCEKINLG